jgi:Ca2+-binding RTX toxin-like protein
MAVDNFTSLLLPGTRRWNDSSPLGTPVTVTYSFMTSLPSYYSNSINNFVPFNNVEMNGSRRALASYGRTFDLNGAEVSSLYGPVSNITFQEVPDSVGGQIRFGTGKFDPELGAWANPPGADADGDVWLNNYYRFDSINTPGEFQFQQIMHEIGHALGLKHPGNYNAGGGGAPEPYLSPEQDNWQYAVMSYNGSGGGTQYTGSSAFPQTPQLYDIAAVQYLYGANTSTRAGDTTYGFDNNTGDPAYSWEYNKPFVMTIWDGGGNDTINAANQLYLPVTIDLRAGSFSSIGPKTSNDLYTPAKDNLALAYGVTIENAIGGIKDDTLVGNEFNNNLFGGFGNDYLNGLEGNDTLDGSYGNDTLIDFSGINQLSGGKDNDTYYIRISDDSNSIITEYADEGTDTVFSVVSDYTLVDNLENLTLVSTATNGRGNDLDNEITGSGVTNNLYGEGGSDTLKGEGDHDALYGGTGDDLMYGGEGNDYLDGWEDNDTLFGGNDIAGINSGNDVLVAWKGNDLIYGGDGEDWLDGSYNEDILYGGEGDDTLGNPVSAEGIGGEPGDDTIYGESGNDKLYGGPGYDYLSGGTENDQLFGRGDSDVLYGEAGDDTLTGFGGGTELDDLYGGLGADIFVLGDASGAFYQGLGYAAIWDFDWTESDKFQVYGSASDYSLQFNSGLDVVDILYKGEQIAAVNNTSNVLISDDFIFTQA